VEGLIAGTRLGTLYAPEIGRFIAGYPDTSYPDIDYTVDNFFRALRGRPALIPVLAVSGRFAAVTAVDLPMRYRGHSGGSPSAQPGDYV
jgi:hypothetical protein